MIGLTMRTQTMTPTKAAVISTQSQRFQGSPT